MYPENEKDLVDSAAEHIEEASIADGLENGAKPQPTAEGEPEGLDSEAGKVDAAVEHIEEASIADGRTK